MGIVRGEQRGLAIDQLDGAHVSADGQMMLVQQRSREWVMIWREF